MKELIILGSGNVAEDILDIIYDINSIKFEYQCIGLLDDDSSRWGQKIDGIEILGPLKIAKEYHDVFFVNSIGSHTNFWKKKNIISTLNLPVSRFATLIHPSAGISRSLEIGAGSVVMRNVSIGPNVSIGYHVLVHPNVLIVHNDTIGDYTCIMGGSIISGNVNIGESCWLAPNCAITGNIEIGRHALIGMGSSVLANVSEACVAVGSPARITRSTYK